MFLAKYWGSHEADNVHKERFSWLRPLTKLLSLKPAYFYNHFLKSCKHIVAYLSFFVYFSTSIPGFYWETPAQK